MICKPGIGFITKPSIDKIPVDQNDGRSSPSRSVALLKWLVTEKNVRFPPSSVQSLFFLVYNMYLYTPESPLSGYLDLKLSNLSLFGGFFEVFKQKGTN